MKQRKIAVSWSRFENFFRCPLKFYLTSIIDKEHTHRIQYVQSEAGARGERIHESLQRALHHGTVLDPEIKHMTERVEMMRQVLKTTDKGKLPWWTELGLTFDENWTPCGRRDWDKIWMRANVDFAFVWGNTLRIVDWKTGKVKKPSDQLALYALAMMRWFEKTGSQPQIEHIQTRYVWCDHPDTPDTVVKYTPADLPQLEAKFYSMSDAIEEANVENCWPAQENFLCAEYCDALPGACAVKEALK
jgi:hypothetical protein